MADSDKNILITPNRSQAAQPSIAFTGKGNVPITLRVLDDSTGTLSFEGSAGQLFSINNNLSTGTIFSVNDVSGIPMIDVDASGLVRLAPLGGTVYSNTLYSLSKTVSGAGNDLTLKAGDGVTSGAGGSIILKPGNQVTTGGNGYIMVDTPTSATINKFRIKNPVTANTFVDFDVDGAVGANQLSVTGVTNGLYTIFLNTNRLTGYQTLFASAGNYINLTGSYLNVAGGQIFFGSGATYQPNQSVALLQGGVGVIRVADAASYATLGSGGGSFAYTSSTPTALAANTNDLVLTGSAFQRLSSSAAYNLTGIAPPSGGAHVDGRVIWLHNVGSFNITLKHSQTSTAANQFINEGGGDIVLGPNRIVQCTYDSTSTKWRVNGEMYPYNFPTTDGTSGQVLSTNGSGTLSWANASSGTGTVTSVSGTGTVNGITLTGTVTSTGNLTLGGSLSNVSLTSQVTGTLPIANGGTNATTALTANANIVDWGQLINHNTIADFNNVQRWGCAFVTGTANGPGVNSASQYYQMMYSLGADYSWGSANVYAMQMAIPRSVTSPYVTVRYKEGGGATAGWGSWQKISAGYADTAGSATSATSATTATNATNVAVTADSTNATRYISFVGATSGNNGTLANSTLTYNPSTGNVGIGTASPSAKLHVVADSALTNPESDIGVYSLFLNSNATTNAGSAIGLGANGTSGAIIVGQRVGANNESVMKLQTRDSAGTAATRVTISSGGNVGIGTTSPSYRLDVAGTIKSAGTGYNTATSPSIYLTNTTATTGRTFIINSANNGAFQVADANASDATRLYLLANGNFGIGNNSSDPGAQLQVTALAAGTKGLIVKGAASQSANLQEWQDSAGNVPISVSSAGTLSIAKSGTRPSYIVLNNTVATESVEVTMQQNGVQRAAFGICGTTNAYILNPPSASDFGFRADNVNILFSMNAGSSVQAMLTSGGRFGVGTSATADVTGMIQANPTSASTKGLVVKAAASQTANLLEIQNSSGTNLVYVDPTGDLLVGVPNATYFPSGAAAPLHVTRPTTAVATAIAAWPTYEPDTQTHARVTAFFTDGGNGGTATVATGTTTIIKFGEYYTGRVVLMPEGAGGQTPADQNSGAGRDIMLLGGKSDNTAGKTGGRVFIQGGSGFAGAYGSNFGDVILQANGGRVCVGGTSPVSTSPGLDITADASSSGTGQLMIKRASTNDRFRLTCGVHTSNYAFIKAYENAIGAINLAIQPDVGSVGIGNTSPGAKLQIDTGAAATKGLIVKGAASQSANLQEWQNNGGTALATVDASGNFSANNYSSTTASSTTLLQTYSKEYSFYRAAPTVVGDYIEICDYNEVTGFMEITAASEAGGGIGHTVKRYHLAAVFAQTRNVIISPICIDRQSGYTSTFDFELESVSISSYTNRLRIRRTAGTSARNLVVSIKLYSPYSHTLTSQTGTGTSSIGNSFWNSLIGTYLAPPPVVGGSGAGNNLTLYGGGGETSGAGGSIILQPGAQATTGGNGVVRFVNPTNTAQYLNQYFSGSNIVSDLVGGGTTATYNYDLTLNGKTLTCAVVTVSSGLIITASMIRAANGTSVQLGSSNGTSTDNINYIWMRQDGHIAWYGDIGLRRDGVGVLSVTNGSTGGGSLAYKSNTTNISTATNNLVLNGSAFQRLNCTAACNLTGIAPPSGSHIDGRMMRIYNVGTANLTLKHNSTSSAIANRFCCVQAVDIILAPRDYAELIYDGTDGGLVGGQNNPCWRVH